MRGAPVCFLYAKVRQVDHLNYQKIKVAVIGPGNIGSDLMYKIMRSPYLEMALMTGIVESEGIRRAAGLGIPVSTEGVAAVVRNPGARPEQDDPVAGRPCRVRGA